VIDPRRPLDNISSCDVQFELCSAYIRSLGSLGQELIEQRFPDDGLSGATLEKPALLRLLKVDVATAPKTKTATLDFTRPPEGAREADHEAVGRQRGGSRGDQADAHFGPSRPAAVGNREMWECPGVDHGQWKFVDRSSGACHSDE